MNTWRVNNFTGILIFVGVCVCVGLCVCVKYVCIHNLHVGVYIPTYVRSNLFFFWLALVNRACTKISMQDQSLGLIDDWLVYWCWGWNPGPLTYTTSKCKQVHAFKLHQMFPLIHLRTFQFCYDHIKIRADSIQLNYYQQCPAIVSQPNPSHPWGKDSRLFSCTTAIYGCLLWSYTQEKIWSIQYCLINVLYSFYKEI